MSLARRMRLAAAGAAADPITDLASVAHTQWDLTAEGLADGTAIGTFTDQTGNGHDATQATEAKKPTAKDAGTGLKVARFDGVDDHAVTAAFTAVPVTTSIILAKYDDVDTASRYLMDGIAPTNRHVLYTPSGTWRFYQGGTERTDGVDDANWHVFVVPLLGTASSALYVDGGAPAVTGDAGANTLTGITFAGRNTITNQFWDGDVNFLSVYAGDLRADNLTLLNTACQALHDRAADAGLTIAAWTDIT